MGMSIEALLSIHDLEGGVEFFTGAVAAGIESLAAGAVLKPLGRPPRNCELSMLAGVEFLVPTVANDLFTVYEV